MAKSYFFYDLETSGLNPRSDRIMQFAGIRTDENLKQIGDSYNLLVKLNDDTLPSPEALMVTGISPQATLSDGYTEAQFAKILYEEIFTPETIAIGFNNIRFDDEFIRYLFWRNFHDAYEWSWKDDRSRWDLLDAVRMTRALRPEGINWPTDAEGKATNRLELLTKENGLAHEKAHDALSDVEALIAVTGLIRDKQPQLFNYLFSMRDKKMVKKLINLDNREPFVYTSGRYNAEYNKTTVAFPLTSSKNGNVVVYDLRYDPTPFFDKSQKELEDIFYASWEERQKKDYTPLPVKDLKYNQVPAVAPVNVLGKENGWEKIGLTLSEIEKHKKILLSRPDFSEKIRTLFENSPAFKKNINPEAQLYDSFLPDKDRSLLYMIQNANANKLADLQPNFIDERLPELLLHYKARSFPKSLSAEEKTKWEEYRILNLNSMLPKFMAELKEIAERDDLTSDEEFIIEELKLWLENVLPDNE